MCSVVPMPNQERTKDGMQARAGRGTVQRRSPGGRLGLDDADRPAARIETTGRPQVSDAWYRCIEDYRLSPADQSSPSACDREFRRLAAAPRRRQSRRPHGAGDDGVQPAAGAAGTPASACSWPTAPARSFTPCDAGSNLGPMGRRLVRLGESWNELIIGNNGLGTAAVLREPVAFDGKEHFSSVLHPFATVGHPLFAHDGTLVALLGLITDQRSSAQTLLGFVRIAELSDRDELVRVSGTGRLYATAAPEQHQRGPDGSGLPA